MRHEGKRGLDTVDERPNEGDQADVNMADPLVIFTIRGTHRGQGGGGRCTYCLRRQMSVVRQAIAIARPKAAAYSIQGALYIRPGNYHPLVISTVSIPEPRCLVSLNPPPPNNRDPHQSPSRFVICERQCWPSCLCALQSNV